MNESECLAKMVAPGQHRPGKWGTGSFGGVIQICVTSSCDRSCFNCTQASNLSRKAWFMSPEQFEQSVLSLKGYPGICGVFGGNPAMSPHFVEYCRIMRELVPFAQRGLWCNNLITQEKGLAAAQTFNPAVSNLNVHLDREAYDNFKRWWPSSMPFGLDKDSRHSPPWVAMKDVVTKLEDDPMEGRGMPVGSMVKVPDESKIWELISNCDINQNWSSMVCVVRGRLRAFFCEIAGAAAMLHQHEEDYPDTGLDITETLYGIRKKGPHQIPWERPETGEENVFQVGPRMEDGKRLLPIFPTDDPPRAMYKRIEWWQLPMASFQKQVRKHCFDCGVPLRGHGELAQSSDPDASEQVSETHRAVYTPKDKRRPLQLVTERSQLGEPLETMTKYLQNANK